MSAHLIEQLSAAVEARGLSNGQLARASGVSVSQIGKYLSGQVSPSVQIYERLVAALTSEPRQTVLDLRDGIIAAGRSTEAIVRACKQFVASMDAESPAGAAAALVDPGVTSDRRVDALVAAVASYVARRRGLESPLWTVYRCVFPSWTFSPAAGLHAITILETPPALSEHGIYMSRTDLEYV